jgi:hypothetical protein
VNPTAGKEHHAVVSVTSNPVTLLVRTTTEDVTPSGIKVRDKAVPSHRDSDGVSTICETVPESDGRGAYTSWASFNERGEKKLFAE